jgi:predicted DNA-binding protein
MSDMKEYRLTVRVNADLRQRLSAAAKRSGQKEADVVRVALDKGLDAIKPKESALDRALALGIVGMIKDGPSDLSTNPKHFEGFGES